ADKSQYQPAVLHFGVETAEPVLTPLAPPLGGFFLSVAQAQGLFHFNLLSNPTPSAGPVCLKKINDLQNVFLRGFRNSRQAYVMPSPHPVIAAKAAIHAGSTGQHRVQGGAVLE
ncbi:MAG: hypothetical protein Q4G70_13255, partial [Pseudomonadota bacterium]|nr:hypothetical protein [Pseudomonadota bacterium]